MAWGCATLVLMHTSSESLLPRDFPGGRLRRLRPADLHAFQTYRRIPGLGRYQSWSPMSDAQALEFLTKMSRSALFINGQWLQLGIAEPAADTLIGDIGIHVSQDGRAGEIGFTLQPSAQGRGIASAAVHSALNLVFANTAITHVLGITDARNHPSVRLLQRLGFKHQESRNAIFRGEHCVEEIFVLSRSDG